VPTGSGIGHMGPGQSGIDGPGHFAPQMFIGELLYEQYPTLWARPGPSLS